MRIGKEAVPCDALDLGVNALLALLDANLDCARAFHDDILERAGALVIPAGLVTHKADGIGGSPCCVLVALVAGEGARVFPLLLLHAG